MTASTPKIPSIRCDHGEAGCYQRPLIPIAAALTAGLWCGGTWPGYLPWVAAVGILAAAWLVRSWFRRQPSRWSALVLMAILGYTLMVPWLPGVFPDRHVSHYTDSRAWHIKGTVTTMLPPRQGRTRLLLDVRHLSDGQRTLIVSGRIRVTVADPLTPIKAGDGLVFASRIRSLRNFNNPGGFDYRRYMAFQRVHGSAFVRGDRLLVDTPARDAAGSFVSRYRERAGLLIEAYSERDTQAVLKALLIGDRETIGQDLRRLFHRCGVGHLLAISGLHIGIVGALVFGGILWLMHRLPFILDRGWGRRAATLMALGPILFYGVLAGLSPSTQRALIMVLAFMATYFVHRDSDPLNFLALAALLMLIARPPALFSISFQMSFSAVFWILWGMSHRWQDKTVAAERPSGWLARIQVFLLVTCWATAGTLPLTMRYFQEVSLIGLLANCVMVPLVGFFVLPVGLIALFGLAIHEGAAGLGIATAGWGLEQGLRLLQTVGALDVIALQTFVPTYYEMICYYGILALCVKWSEARSWRVAAAALILVLVCADGLYWGYQRFWHRDLRVTILDVGQGSAALVEFPGGTTMLIDGGGYTDNRYFDVGARVVAPVLRYRKVMQVDVLVLSHPSSDHMNGLVYVLGHFHPQKLIWTGDRASTESFRRFSREVARSGVAVPPWHAIERRMVIGGVVVDILNPPMETKAGLPLSGEALNNRSLVLKLTMDQSAILFTGDIEARTEAALIACCRPQLSSQVLVAPHHGSQTSSTINFIDAIDPTLVLFTVGWRNRFGFPHADVMERYRVRGSRLYRTDEHGALHLKTGGHQWTIKTQLE